MAAPLSGEDVKRLAGVDGGATPVLSVYLNVDGRVYPRRGDYEVHLDALLREAKAKGADGADIAWVRDHVKAGFDRSATRGLALFACHAIGFHETFHLPWPVDNEMAASHAPAIRALEVLLNDLKRFAVVLVDRSRTRIFRFHLGRIEERTEWADDVMGQHDQGGWSQARYARHVDDEAHKHLKAAALATFHMFEAEPFDNVLLGGPDEVVAEFRRLLHPYLVERVAGSISVSLADPVDAIRRAALDVEEAIEREAEAAVVDRLRAAVGRHNGGVSGLGPVLEALGQRRAEVLLVSRGFVQPGWRCAACDTLTAVGPQCRVCGTAMTRVDDVVEEAIEEAVAQSATVEMVAGNADLDVMGRIGAILRY